ncbi:MAG: hypothetical protein ACLGGV_06235 [Bacteroidia bacterium]
MILRVVTIAFLVLSINAFAQGNAQKEIVIPKYRGEKIYWYDSLKFLSSNLNLANLEKDYSHIKHVRLWTDKQVVDVWQSKDSNFHCTVTSFVREYDSRKELEGKFYSESVQLEPISAMILLDSLQLNHMADYKDCHNIKKYNHDKIDGEFYRIELSTPVSYRLITLLNPEEQSKNIDEVNLFLEYLELVRDEMDLEYLHRQFMMGLKKGTYVAGLSLITKKK